MDWTKSNNGPCRLIFRTALSMYHLGLTMYHQNPQVTDGWAYHSGNRLANASSCLASTGMCFRTILCAERCTAG